MKRNTLKVSEDFKINLSNSSFKYFDLSLFRKQSNILSITHLGAKTLDVYITPAFKKIILIDI
jgi:hypothetical protein